MDLLSQRNRREDEGRRKDTCVFRHGDCTLPAEMLSWWTLRSVTSGEAVMRRTDGTQHTPKICNSNRRLKLPNGFLGGKEKGS